MKHDVFRDFLIFITPMMILNIDLQKKTPDVAQTFRKSNICLEYKYNCLVCVIIRVVNRFGHMLGPWGLKHKSHAQRSRSLLISDRSATTGDLDGSIFFVKSKIWSPFWAPPGAPWRRRQNNSGNLAGPPPRWAEISSRS